ncbi:MAG: alpha-mannosidase, partial [Clostridiales bacterium]|nr:alpha-mannosidase [Clostridiales bacterium]
YHEVEKQLEMLKAALPSDGRLFNTLNAARKLPVFVEGEDGANVRHGRKGTWMQAEAEGLSSVRPAPLCGKEDWIRITEEEQGLHVQTAEADLHLRQDGSFASYRDLVLDREWVREGCGFNTLHLYADNPGVYDAWDILPNYKDVSYPLKIQEPLHVTWLDSRVAEMTVVFATEKSTWKMTLRLLQGQRGVEVEHCADWHEKHRLMKVNFGPDIVTREVVCDTSAGMIRRDLTKNTTWQQARFEVCHHKWFDLSETGAGVAVVNESKYGLGLEGNEVSLSLLRATIRPDIASDMGTHDFCYLIYPHAGDAVQAGVNQLALEYNVPMSPWNVDVPEALRGALNASGLYLQAMKLSEDGKQIVIRLSEQDGRRSTVRFPFAVRTLNMLEDAEGETRELAVHPFEIVTIGVDPSVLRE